MNFFTRSKEK